MAPTIQERLLRLVRSRIGTFDSLAVQWFGGEPLRSMVIIEELSRELLAIASSASASYAATVITNGYLMTPAVSHKLVDLGVVAVQITLDGDRQLHDRTRRERGGQGSFDVILENIKNTPNEMAVTIRVHLAPFNRASVISLIDTLADSDIGSYIHAIYFAPLFNYRVGMTGNAYRPDGLRFTTSEKFAEMQTELLTIASARGLPIRDFLDVSYGICTAVRSNTIVVDSEGRLTKCYKDVGVEEEAVGDVEGGVQASDNLDKWLSVDSARR